MLRLDVRPPLKGCNLATLVYLMPGVTVGQVGETLSGPGGLGTRLLGYTTGGVRAFLNVPK
ncbi:MAG: hypothetical protein ACREBE_13800 [bacterium]